MKKRFLVFLVVVLTVQQFIIAFALLAEQKGDKNRRLKAKLVDGIETWETEAFVQPGAPEDYYIEARAGETLSVSVKPINAPALSFGITVFAPDGSRLGGAAKCWSDDVPRAGDYKVQISTFGERKRFSLQIQLRRDNPIASARRNSRDPLLNCATPPQITLSASSVSSRNGRVQINTGEDPEADIFSFLYETSGGRIIGDESGTVWDLTGVAPGTYTLKVEIDDGCRCYSKLCKCPSTGPTFTTMTVTVTP